MDNTFYTVWVGGIEVNDWLIKCETDAKELASIYRNQGYDDVSIVKINEPKIK